MYSYLVGVHLIVWIFVVFYLWLYVISLRLLILGVNVQQIVRAMIASCSTSIALCFSHLNSISLALSKIFIMNSTMEVPLGHD